MGLLILPKVKGALFIFTNWIEHKIVFLDGYKFKYLFLYWKHIHFLFYDVLGHAIHSFLSGLSWFLHGEAVINHSITSSPSHLVQALAPLPTSIPLWWVGVRRMAGTEVWLSPQHVVTGQSTFNFSRKVAIYWSDGSHHTHSGFGLTKLLVKPCQRFLILHTHLGRAEASLIGNLTLLVGKVFVCEVIGPYQKHTTSLNS